MPPWERISALLVNRMSVSRAPFAPNRSGSTPAVEANEFSALDRVSSLSASGCTCSAIGARSAPWSNASTRSRAPVAADAAASNDSAAACNCCRAPGSTTPS